MCKKILKLFIGFSLLLVFLVGIKFISTNYNMGLMCVFNKITGLYCPGCGMTRAVFSMMDLEFYQAFRYNIFSIMLLPVLIIYFVGEIYGWLFSRKNPIDTKIPKLFWIIIVVLMLMYGILRNISMFYFLAPTII